MLCRCVIVDDGNIVKGVRDLSIVVYGAIQELTSAIQRNKTMGSEQVDTPDR